ncbi:MAG: flagellar protein FlgN [Lachnospiraceae bacterium]|nr:flagellar protein FlgN [Lachnospiraceae bacterium]
MEQTYVDIMIQSLKKKIKVLEEIKRVNVVQKELLENDRADVDDFDVTVEAKSKLIEQMEQLDSGFDKLFERVREELQANKPAYTNQIKEMQTCIRKITDLSMEIQSQEAKNKDLMTQKFVSVRQKAKVVRTNSKAASQYYKNMMQLNVVDPQFMDNKK